MDEIRARQQVRQSVRQQTLAAAAAIGTARDRSTSDVFRVIGLLSKSDPKVREGAVMTLSQIRGQQAIGAIARCIDDIDAIVRTAACAALGHLRAHSVKHALYDAVEDHDAKVSCTAAEALYKMGDNYGTAYVKKWVVTKGDHQKYALRVLNTITNKRFRLNDAGLKAAVNWIRPKKFKFLRF